MRTSTQRTRNSATEEATRYAPALCGISVASKEEEIDGPKKLLLQKQTNGNLYHALAFACVKNERVSAPRAASAKLEISTKRAGIAFRVVLLCVGVSRRGFPLAKAHLKVPTRASQCIRSLTR